MFSTNTVFLALVFFHQTILWTTTEANVIGKEICISGYVMDLFCINRGTLLDNPRVRTLEEPERHSYHCLLDVGACVNSGYEILLDPVNQTFYNRGVRLDDTGNQLVLDVGRAHGKSGSCSTCTEVHNSNSVGFRATAIGTIINLGSSSSPPTLAVAEFGAELDLDCPENMTNIADMMGDFPFIQTPSGGVGTSSFSKAAYIHGSLMIISWGWLIPSGAIIARFYKHQSPLWFKLHRICQCIGLILAFTGFGIALKNFDALSQKGYTAFYHAVMGIVVMSLGFLQPLNAVFRPHNPEEGELKKTSRKLWEFCHKSIGWFACALAIATIGIGTTLLPQNQMTFQVAYGAGCGFLLFTLIATLINDRKSKNRS